MDNFQGQTKMKKIQCLAGSRRIEATRMTVMYAIAERYENQTNLTIYASLATLPHFAPNAEDTALPQTAQYLCPEVATADAVIICTPEYVFSVRGILKNAIEWCVASAVFSDKPTAMIVASRVGEKTFESLALTMKTIQT